MVFGKPVNFAGATMTLAMPNVVNITKVTNIRGKILTRTNSGTKIQDHNIISAQNPLHISHN